jgi:hypothetical protein
MTDKAVQPDEGVVERNALLFRAGAYPDRDIEITEEDLDRMVEGYTPAPIKVEHTDTPLRFGVVTKIWRVGKELFGRLAFNPLAWALARECGATRLSVAVRRDKSGLQEVSLVRSPRIADAAVFGGESSESKEPSESRAAEYFAGDDLSASEGGDCVESVERDEQVGAESQEQPVEFADRVFALEKELKVKDVDARIDDLKRRGKLAPAAEAFARSLLMADDQVVAFSDPATGSETREQVAKTFEAFLEAQPKVIEFSELTPAVRGEKPAFSSEDEQLFEKLGVTAEAVSKVLGS